MYNNVMVVFENSNIRDNIEKILCRIGIRPSLVSSSGHDILKNCRYVSKGIIVCGYKFKDGVCINSILDDIPQEYNVILIGDMCDISMCEDERVFKLVCPIMINEFVDYINLFLNQAHITKEEKYIIDAKKFLIDKYNLTENQAHKYIQKKSMDNGIKSVEIAKIILGK